MMNSLSTGKAQNKDCQASLEISEKTVTSAFREMLDGKINPLHIHIYDNKRLQTHNYLLRDIISKY